MSINWRSAGRTTGILLAGVLVFLLSLIIFIGLLVSTERGTRVTLNLAERFAPGELVVEHQHGSLMRELALQRVTYTDQTLSLEIEQLLVDWRPRQLLANTLHVKNLEFASMVVNFEPSAVEDEDDQQAEFQLADVNLPVDVLIDRVHLNNINLQIGTFTQHIERIELVAESRGYEQYIEHLLVRIEEGEVTASGVIETRANYPLNLSVQSSLSLPDLHQLNLQADLDGDLDTLNIKVVSEGLADAELTARVDDLLRIDALTWQAGLQLDAVRHDALYEQVRALSVAIQSEGSLETFEVMLDGDIETVEHGLVDLSGHLAWQDMQLVIHELEANFEDRPAYVEIEGTAAFGDILDVDIRGYADILGFTVSEFSLRATGDETGAQDLTLSLDIPQGQAEISGSLLWQPYLSWDLAVQLSEVNLADLNENLQGELALELLTTGQLDEILELYVNIGQLSGNIFEHSIAGQGELRVQGDTFTADSIDIVWGDASIQADGHYSPDTLDLTWLVDVPNLANLLPSGEGRIQSRGQVVGSQAQPRLQLELNVNDFRWEDYQLEESVINVEIDGTLANLPVGDIRVRHLQVNDQLVESIDVRMRENEQHTVEADIDYGDLQARLALRGNWDLEQQAWQGELHRMQLRYPDIGRWNLSNPATLLVSPQQAQLGDFCLIISTRESQLCADGRWTAESGDIELALRAEDVPYQLFNPMVLVS
ncbi:MAG: hypothetical protein M1363_02515, partial [Gammaproteobacteria bacterium]|nr:hypothetical protein [Gammaproteobacteria bacterium]